MKRKLIIVCALALVLVLGLSLCTACKKNKKDDEQTNEVVIPDAILTKCLSELDRFYKNASSETAVNYVVIGSTPSYFDDDGNEWSVKISWAIQGTTEVTISKRNDGKYEIVVPADNESAINYTLVGTLVNEKGEAYKKADGKTFAYSMPKTVPGGKGSGSSDAPYSVAGVLAEYAVLANKEYSKEIVYVKGYVVTKPSYDSKYNSYKFDMADTRGGTSVLYVYGCAAAEGISELYVNDEIVVHGYIEKFNDKLEITYKTSGDNSAVIDSRVAGTSNITVAENENAQVSLSKTSGTNGENFTFTVEAKNGHEITFVKVNGAKAVENNGTYTARIEGNMEVSVGTKDPSAPFDGVVTVDMSTNFGTYAKDWNSSYGTKTLARSDLGISAVDLTVTLSYANKSTSTITDKPVMACKGNEQYITISVAEGSISSATINLAQWAPSKTFYVVTLEYSTDGTNWTKVDGVGYEDETSTIGKNIDTIGATLAVTDLPSGVKAVRVRLYANYVYQDKTQNTQVGFAGFTIVWEEPDAE